MFYMPLFLDYSLTTRPQGGEAEGGEKGGGLTREYWNFVVDFGFAVVFKIKRSRRRRRRRRRSTKRRKRVDHEQGCARSTCHTGICYVPKITNRHSRIWVGGGGEGLNTRVHGYSCIEITKGRLQMNVYKSPARGFLGLPIDVFVCMSNDGTAMGRNIRS